MLANLSTSSGVTASMIAQSLPHQKSARLSISFLPPWDGQRFPLKGRSRHLPIINGCLSLQASPLQMQKTSLPSARRQQSAHRHPRFLHQAARLPMPITLMHPLLARCLAWKASRLPRSLHSHQMRARLAVARNQMNATGVCEGKSDHSRCRSGRLWRTLAISQRLQQNPRSASRLWSYQSNVEGRRKL